MSSHFRSFLRTLKAGIAAKVGRPATKTVAATSSFALLVLGLGGAGIALSAIGSSHADAQATLPLVELLPDYGKNVLAPPPGSTQYPGLMTQPTTYEIYATPASNNVTAAEWPAAMEQAFGVVSSNLGGVVSGYQHMIALPGDTIIGHGGVAMGMSSGGGNPPAGIDISALYAPAAGYFTDSVFSTVLTDFEYTPGSNNCATGQPYVTPSGTVNNLWCLGIGTFVFKIADLPEPPSGLEWHFGFEPNWQKIMTDYPGIEKSATAKNGQLYYLGGPNNPQLGANATNEGYIMVPSPSLQLIKEVCSTGTGCIDDPDSDADTPVPDSEVNTGLWVDAATLPMGSTSAEWRITVKNTGNIEVTDVHLANDKTVTATVDDAAKLGADDCMDAGSNMGSLMPGASATVYCTTPISSDLESSAVNWANANASIPMYINPNTGAVADPSDPDAVELSLPDGAVDEQTLAANYQGNAQADGANVVGMVPSNSDAAMISFPAPALKLTKWVCGADSCDTPTGDDLAALAGYSQDGAVAGQSAGGWVRAAQVNWGDAAQWLMIATNIGNTAIANVTISSDVVTDGGDDQGVTQSNVTKVTGDDPLQPGESAIFTATTDHITSLGNSGSQGSVLIDPINLNDSSGNTLLSFHTGELAYTPGNDVVNTATASGTPVDDSNNPLKDSTGADLEVVSNESVAEVTTIPIPEPVEPNPGIKLTKWVCSDYADGEPACPIPTGDDLATLAGYSHDTGVATGQELLGWVKYTSVDYGSDVEWLMIATNIGNTYLKDVTLSMEEVLINGVVIETNQEFTQVAGDQVGALLPPGGSILYTGSTHDIVAGGLPGGPSGSTIQLSVSGTGYTYNTDELAYTPGDDVVNEAVAHGTPTDDSGVVLFFLGTPNDSDPVEIDSNESLAEVSTAKDVLPTPIHPPSNSPSTSSQTSTSSQSSTSQSSTESQSTTSTSSQSPTDTSSQSSTSTSSQTPTDTSSQTPPPIVTPSPTPTMTLTPTTKPAAPSQQAETGGRLAGNGWGVGLALLAVATLVIVWMTQTGAVFSKLRRR